MNLEHDIGFIKAKLEDIEHDIKYLQGQVSELKKFKYTIYGVAAGISTFVSGAGVVLMKVLS